MDSACAVGLERRLTGVCLGVLRVVHLGHHYHTDSQMTNFRGDKSRDTRSWGRQDGSLSTTIFLATEGRKTSDLALPIMLPLVILVMLANQWSSLRVMLTGY